MNRREIMWQAQVNKIKEYIKEKASTFEDDFYNNFEPILGKLLEVFNLN